jgi:hypothetical protein
MFEEAGMMSRDKREKFIKRFIDPMLAHNISLNLLLAINKGPYTVKIAWGNKQLGITGTIAKNRAQAVGGNGSEAVILIDEEGSDWKKLETIVAHPDVGLFHELVHARHTQL